MKKIPMLFPLAVAALLDGAAIAAESPNGPPAGIYLWYSESAGRPTDDDCKALVQRIHPSRAKAEDWLWGRVPEGDPKSMEFYLLVSKSRMEPTFSAEGDYDSGAVAFGSTVDGETPFTLVPDDHPDTTIHGTISAKTGSQVVSVTLKAIPLDDGTADRTTYYCRFDDEGTET